MLTNYHTLHALVQAWRADLVGCVLGDAYSQVRDELTLALASPETTWMVRCSVQGGLHYLFRGEGYNKARRNVATLFDAAIDHRVVDVRIAERDRMLYLDLEDGLTLQIVLFGPRANVFLTGRDGRVVEAFKHDEKHRGAPAPTPRAAPAVPTFEVFETRWPGRGKTVERALTSAFPLLDQMLAAEVRHRAGVPDGDPEACTEAERRQLFEAARDLFDAFAAPEPCVYWDDRRPEAFALVPLQTMAAAYEEERFETLDDAVRVYVRRLLADRHFRRLYEPLEQALAQAADDYARKADRMLEELSHESRAERYEHWGHLLMAQAAGQPAGADEITLPDLFAEAPEAPAVTIPLDPKRTGVENAERYYAKARQTRQAREHAERRLDEMVTKADEAAALLEELRGLERAADVETFRKDEAARLAPFVASSAADVDRVPFRRFALSDRYELWVAKNARQNDELTFRHAQKYDLWFHARGVPGSHAVLRLPHRDAEPPRGVLEQAAGIAAYYSKARGSGLVPVMMAPRKYVRKPKGAPAGAVLVEHEEVLLVEPRAPQGV